jgi:hypothetical protein
MNGKNRIEEWCRQGKWFLPREYDDKVYFRGCPHDEINAGGTNVVTGKVMLLWLVRDTYSELKALVTITATNDHDNNGVFWNITQILSVAFDVTFLTKLVLQSRLSVLGTSFFPGRSPRRYGSLLCHSMSEHWLHKRQVKRPF